jgi:hypothetical protein
MSTFASGSSKNRREAGRRDFLGLVGAAVSSAIAGLVLGAMSSDTARQAIPLVHTFDPALLCRAQTTAALPARAAKRVQFLAPNSGGTK